MSKIRNGEYRNCLTCNRQIYVTVSAMRVGKGKYCDYRCRNASMRADNNPMRRVKLEKTGK